MINMFKVAILLITLCAVSFAYAQQAPPSAMSLSEFQQWMQQQKGTSNAPPPTATVTNQVAVPVVPAQSQAAIVTPPSSTTVITGAPAEALPPPGGGLPPPGGAVLPPGATVVTPVTAGGAPPGAVLVPVGPNRPIRPEMTQFKSELERKGAIVMGPRVVARRRVSRDRPLSYDESRRIMLRSVPHSLAPPIPESDYAFNTLLQQNTPLTPQQVVKLHQQIDISQRAAATPPLIPPKPVSTTMMINLAPGTTPPAIRLAVGYVSSLVFVDSTGAPWPIAAFDIGNPKAVNIQWDGKGNIILIQALAPYSYGDMVVRLAGLPTPVTLEIVSGQRVVDYRVDIHVPGIGPNTTDLPIGSSLPNPASSLLLDVLEGVAPPGSRALSVRGADCQAWMLGERMYLRCRLTLLSPGWIGKMVSPDGMNAYELPKTSSILVSRYGEPSELKIEGF